MNEKAFALPQMHFDITSLSLNPWETEQIQKFIADVDDSLPISVKQTLNQKIFLEFQDFFSGLIFRTADLVLLDKKCIEENIFVNEPKLIDNSEKTQIRGNTHLSRYGEKKIVLNKLYLNEIFLGDKNSKAYNCGHKNSYQLAKATLLHEIGHLYDLEKKVSSDRRFLHLTTFKSNLLFMTGQKNQRKDRSPDIYEVTDPKESFAVNLEYFLIDPEFKCRRPALYEYYKEALLHEPFPNASCKINNTVEVVGFVSKKMNLDPSLLYRVDYLLADKGTSVESRFGHSMLRLLFCPSRNSTEEACLKDQTNHVIVSFRANFFDEESDDSSGVFSTLKYYLKGVGLKGSFPSIMYLFQLPLTLAEYNHYDYRDIVSTPLLLNQDEKRNLIYRILEINHGYQGSYQFFTNNCKNETEDLLKAIIKDPNIEKLNKLTPVSMRQGLIDLKIADETKEVTYRSIQPALFKASEEFKHNFNYIYTPSKELRLAKFLNFADFKDQKTLVEYITRYSADERREFFQTIYRNFYGKDEKIYKNVIGSLLTLESGTLLHYTFQTIKTTLTFFEALSGDINQLAKILDTDTFQKVKEIAEQNASNPQESPEEKKYSKRTSGPIYKGYGIIMHQDLIRASVAVDAPQLSANSQSVLSSAISKYTKNIVEELNKTHKNITLLRTLLLIK